MPAADLQAEARSLLDRLERAQTAGAADLAAIDDFVARAGTGTGTDSEVVQAVAYSLLWKATALIDAGRLDDAVAAARALVAAFVAAPERNVTGLGRMLLDLGFLLLAHEQPEPLLEACEPVIGRLDADGPGRRAVAAGALFYKSQALSRLGRSDEAEAASAILHAMGEPAIAALDRIDAQFGPEDRNTLWHAQIVVHRALVLIGLGRAEEARTVLAHARQVFVRHDLPGELAESMLALEQEIAGSSGPGRLPG